MPSASASTRLVSALTRLCTSDSCHTFSSYRLEDPDSDETKACEMTPIAQAHPFPSKMSTWTHCCSYMTRVHSELRIGLQRSTSGPFRGVKPTLFPFPWKSWTLRTSARRRFSSNARRASSSSAHTLAHSFNPVASPCHVSCVSDSSISLRPPPLQLLYRERMTKMYDYEKYGCPSKQPSVLARPSQSLPSCLRQHNDFSGDIGWRRQGAPRDPAPPTPRP